MGWVWDPYDRFVSNLPLSMCHDLHIIIGVMLLTGDNAVKGDRRLFCLVFHIVGCIRFDLAELIRQPNLHFGGSKSGPMKSFGRHFRCHSEGKLCWCAQPIGC